MAGRVAQLAMHGASEAVAREAAEAVARRSYGKLVALLTARTRDVAGAEDALSSALATALVDWPASGVPRNPEAWVLAVARRRCIDAARRRRSAETAAGHLRLMAEEIEAGTERPDGALRPDVRLRPPRHRPRHSRTAPPPGPLRVRRRRDRLGLPRLARRDEPTARARQEEDPRGRASTRAAGGRRARRASRRGARGDRHRPPASGGSVRGIRRREEIRRKRLALWPRFGLASASMIARAPREKVVKPPGWT